MASDASANMSGEVNPYASPHGMDQPRVLDAGIGVWRDGRFVVLHRQASLPPYCIAMGEPACQTYRLTIQWNYPIDLMRRTLRIDIPLGERAYRYFQYRRRQAGGLLVVAAAMMCLAVAFALFHLICASIGLTLLCIPFTAYGAARYDRASQLLIFKEARGDYLWLDGAGAPFLDRLPEWPYGK